MRRPNPVVAKKKETRPRSVARDMKSLEDLIRIPPFHKYLDVRLVAVDEHHVRLRVPYKPEFIGNPRVPAWHGGIISALIDLAGGAVLFPITNIPTPTIDMRVDFIRPAVAKQGTAILADAHVIRCGKTIGHVRVDVTDEGTGKLVAVGSCVYSVKDQERPPEGAHPIG